MKVSTKPKNYSAWDIYKAFTKPLIKKKYFKGTRVQGRSNFILHVDKNKVEKALYNTKKILEGLRQEELKRKVYVDTEITPKQRYNDSLKLLTMMSTVRKDKNKLHGLLKQEDPFYIGYTKFKEVLSTYNKLAGELIIEGGSVNLLSRLGHLSMKRVERNFNKVKVNWGESMKYKKELVAEGKQPKDETHPDGENWIIPFADDDWCRVGWRKAGGVKNISVYCFTPAGSSKGVGFKDKIKKALRENPALKYSYPYFKQK